MSGWDAFQATNNFYGVDGVLQLLNSGRDALARKRSDILETREKKTRELLPDYQNPKD